MPKRGNSFSINDKGQPVDPFTGELLVPIGELRKAAGQIPERMSKEEADRRMQELLDQGWRIQAEIAQERGLGATLSMRTGKLEPESAYLPNGCKPKQHGEVTVQGKDLFWKHPTNLHIILLAPSYWQAVIAAEKKHKLLLEKGYRLQSEVVKESKLKPTTLSVRTAQIKLEKDYLPSGVPPLGLKDEVTVKGEILRWQHPYNKDITLLSPTYAAAIIAAENKKRDLIAQGYVDQNTAAEKVGVAVRWRTQKIVPDSNYLPDGKKPTGAEGEVAVKGSVLRWRHPYDPKLVLLSKEYVTGMMEAEKKHQQLQQQGYVKQSKVAKETEFSSTGIKHRASNIIANGDYLPSGLPPTGAEEEVTVKGAALRWVHPYDSNIVLLRESYAKAMAEADKKEKELLSKKYQKQSDIAKAAGLSTSALARRSNKLNPDADYLPDARKPTGAHEETTVKGSELRWQHPYDTNTVLLSSAYAEGTIAAEKKCAELLAKKYRIQGDVGRIIGLEKSSILPDYTRAQIKPDAQYLSNGQKPTGADGEMVFKGSELRWQHPYNNGFVLLYPDYATAVIQEFSASAKKRLRIQQGATTEKLIESVLPQTDKGKPGQPKKDIQKTSPATKVGDMDESKLPEGVKQELEEKRENQRSK